MTSDVKLLPLPEPAISERGTGMGRHDVYHVPRWFTPEQMQAYARACLESAQPRQDVPESVAALLTRCRDCWEDNEGADIGRDKLDALTALGFLQKAGRGRWDFTPLGTAILDCAHPAPAPDVARLVEAADYAARFILDFSALTYSPHSCERAAERLKEALRPFTATQQEVQS